MKTKLIIFGITGDLSRRKLLPALTEIVQTGEYDELSIIGVSRRQVDISELVSDTELAKRTSIVTMDLAKADDYVNLKSQLNLSDDDQALIYLSVPPGAAADIADFLGQAGLNTPNVKLLFEKPFGFDLASAKEFIERTGQYFGEDQIYRIDHYMAKEVAQAIISLRSDVESHHHHWSNQAVKNIQIVASETIGVEGRGEFYEQTGALRDVVQGHLMQLLALVLMPAIENFRFKDLPMYRFKALQQLELTDPRQSVRAQYNGYGEEIGNPGSQTETFVSLQLHSEHPDWTGVPLNLTTGKALDQKRTAITITYKDGTTDVFEEGKIAYEGRLPDPYERVLLAAIAGHKAIFTTSSEILESWRVLEPVQEAWSMNSEPLRQYQKGSDITTISP